MLIFYPINAMLKNTLFEKVWGYEDIDSENY